MALTTKHHLMPGPAIMRPASAGPMVRAAVISALFRPTALGTSSSLTSSTTNARRAGLSMAVRTPKRVTMP
jgi:hypothetical protein